MLTVADSHRLKGRDVLDFLKDAVVSDLRLRPAPSFGKAGKCRLHPPIEIRTMSRGN